MSNILESLEKITLDLVESEGFILYDLEFNEKQRKLIITIDKKSDKKDDPKATAETSVEAAAPKKVKIMGKAEANQEREEFSGGTGVSIDDCAKISRALNLLLDVEDVVPGENPYDLEVSSPGLERDLKKVWHYESALGKPAKVVIKKGEEANEFNNLRSFKAVIDKVDGEQIYFKDVENSKVKSFAVPFDVIHKAHVVFEYGRQKKH